MSRPVHWFERERIPSDKRIFLSTAYASLREIEATLDDPLDLTEGTGDLLITGCIRAYRQAVMRRVLDLTQATATLWNAGSWFGAVVCSRALLETIAVFHSFLTRAQAASAEKDWLKIGRLVDAYAFSSSPGPKKGKLPPEHPPRVGRMVSDFIKATQPGAEHFWDQICDAAHPNGRTMMDMAGTLRDQKFFASEPVEDEGVLFQAVYNCVYSCNWLLCADQEDLEILLEEIRTGGPLPPDHPLIVERGQLDKIVDESTQTHGAQFPPDTKGT